MVDYSAQTPEYVEAALYGTDSYRNMMDLSPDPHTNEIVDYYKAMLSIGEIEGDENAMDQYATSEVYKRALDRLVAQYPDNPVSYTHLDVYKRQLDIRCTPKSTVKSSRLVDPMRPPGVKRFSKSATFLPEWASSNADAKPPTPAPITIAS